MRNRRFVTLLASIIAAVSFGLSTPQLVTAQDDTGADTTTVTVNEFLPTDRDLSECISALPKPGCGSDARGGWRQTAIFGLVLAGLGFIAWRVIVGARRQPPARVDND